MASILRSFDTNFLRPDLDLKIKLHDEDWRKDYVEVKLLILSTRPDQTARLKVKVCYGNAAGESRTHFFHTHSFKERKKKGRQCSNLLLLCLFSSGKKNIRIKKKKKFQSYYCVLPASYYAYTCDKRHPRCRLPRNWFQQAEEVVCLARRTAGDLAWRKGRSLVT